MVWLGSVFLASASLRVGLMAKKQFVREEVLKKIFDTEIAMMGDNYST
jgi:hypothetical protein